MDPVCTIENTNLADLDFIFGLFDQSIAYQKNKGYTVWGNYDKDVLSGDIQNRNQYKIIMDSTIAMVFSMCYSDAIIWREMENDDSVYLHRIVVNPACKGKRLFGELLTWVKAHAIQKNLRFIRMDTWADNPTIIEYYKSFGFSVIENFTTPNSTELPAHNRNLAITLLQIRL
ncbi:MAG TPA: GNAT family N-acetyltransferase [Ohtaekwangia sp.]